jgi:hypothetical protein
MPADPMLRLASAKEWNAWLERHHELPHRLWLELAKKGAAFTTVTSAEALEVALAVNRRAEGGGGQVTVEAALHAEASPQHLVEGEPREGRAPHP